MTRSIRFSFTSLALVFALIAGQAQLAQAAPKGATPGKVVHVHKKQRRILRPALWAAAISGTVTAAALHFIGGPGAAEIASNHMTSLHSMATNWGGTAIDAVQTVAPQVKAAAHAPFSVGMGLLTGATIGTLNVLKRAIFH